ncbi:MAG: SNF2-related protein [Acidimicrobiaceae bacterium]|nr:SNF2-related protein [Acidimicrobiaceae bacterium]
MPSAERDAKAAYQVEKKRIVREQMSSMPLDALKRASDGRLRLGAIESAGIRTVGAVQAARRHRLEAIPGVGPKTATQVHGAASQIEEALNREARVRFDIDRRPDEQTSLLSALHEVQAARRDLEPLHATLQRVAELVETDIAGARLACRRIRRLFARRQRKEEALEAYDRLLRLLNDPSTAALNTSLESVRRRMSRPLDAVTLWNKYASNVVEFNGLLIEISGQKPDQDASEGFLPEEIVESIRAFSLDTALLKSSLRGYQAFGAKFALVQRRVILGDEMGLGKTIEALAVLCHLHAHGAACFLVVCPASVLANWEHEVRRHSRLESVWQLHGAGRSHRRWQWAHHGGVAITTFDTLRALEPLDRTLDAVVIDEAHYVKNPDAIRTRAARAWLDRADLALLMSGTPMENSVEEFRSLVSRVRPDIARTIRSTDGIGGADAFRKAVAPVYLRRNQTDVLNELPEKIETAEWLTLDGAAAKVYGRAVAQGNFMAMRRAAFLTRAPEDSPKLSRLLEIVDEAAENDRKVVVYSYFREVIDRIDSALGRRSVGPLTGDVPARDRQVLVDRFSERREPAVLVSQVQAGGVGLNIQAASVVILAEPQWKPSTEEQAVARCHRMGQARPVEVHRLLTENSVDERMLIVLARKSALFADYVRASAMRDAAPDAIDVTDIDSTREVASQVEVERRIIELERRRLSMDAPTSRFIGTAADL